MTWETLTKHLLWLKFTDHFTVKTNLHAFYYECCWLHKNETTHLHCQTQFQSFRTGWFFSSIICPSSSSIRASVSGGAHSWSRSVAARIRFPEVPNTPNYKSHVPQWLQQHTNARMRWCLHNTDVIPATSKGGCGYNLCVVWILRV